MSDRLDPEMRAAKERTDALAATLPPATAVPPLDLSRLTNERLGLMWEDGLPVLPVSQERWIPARGRRIQCRLHKPVDRPGLPVLVWFHGGGWVWQSIDTHDKLCRELAKAGQVAVVTVDYALSPEAKFPQALFECADVVRWLATYGADWGLDPARIVIGGDSAGGNLALGAALLLRDQGGPSLRGVLAPYPATNADFTTASYTEFADGFGLTRAAMETYWSLYTRDMADRLNPLAAPLLGDLAGLPPVLIQLAELDVLRDDGIAMAERLRTAGVVADLETYAGMLHGFLRFSSAVAKSREAIRSAGAWLARVTA